MPPKPYCALCLAGHAISESVQNSSKRGGMIYSGKQQAAEFCPRTLNFGMYRISTLRPCPAMRPNNTISIQIACRRIKNYRICTFHNRGCGARPRFHQQQIAYTSTKPSGARQRTKLGHPARSISYRVIHVELFNQQQYPGGAPPN